MSKRLKSCRNCGELWQPSPGDPPMRNWCSPDCGFQIHKDRKKLSDYAKAISPRKRKRKGAPTLEEMRQQAMKSRQLLCRLAEADDNGYVKCWTCDAVRYYSSGMQGGHFVPRQNRHYCIDPRNIHPQCEDCNGNGMKFHGKEAVYTLRMQEMYGLELVDKMLNGPHGVRKFTKAELEEDLKESKKQIKYHKDRIGIQ